MPFLIVAVLLVAWLLPPGTVGAQGEPQLKLFASVVPNTLPADGNTYPVLFVQLVRPDGSPIQAKQELAIFVTSSNPRVVKTPGQVAITSGSSYTQVDLAVSEVPGKAKVSVTALGYGSATTEVETVDPLGAVPPYRLVVVAAPPVLFPGGFGVLTVTLLGSNGVPRLAPSDVSVVLTSSEPVVAQAPPQMVIPKGQHYQIAEWEALAAGQVSLLAQATGVEAGRAAVRVSELDAKPDRLVEAGRAAVRVSELGTKPDRLEVYPVLPSLLTRAGEQEGLVLQSVDKEGRPVPFPCTSVHLTSSMPEVISVASPLSVSCDPSPPYLRQRLTSGGSPGQAAVTAGATGLVGPTIPVVSYGRIESQLKLALAPNRPLALDPIPAVLMVHLADANGHPVAVHSPLKITLFSTSGLLPAEVEIPAGRSFVAVSLTREPPRGPIHVTAFAPDLEGASLSFAIEKKALEVSLGVPKAVVALGIQIEVTATITSQGEPVEGAQVTWEIPGALSESSSAQTDSSGSARIAVRPALAGTLRITAQASRMGYSEATAAENVAVVGPETGQGHSRWPLILLGATVLATMGGYFGYRVWRRRTPADRTNP